MNKRGKAEGEIRLNGKPAKKPGPKGPRIPLSDKEYSQLVNMIRIHCTAVEIADVFQMSIHTLNKRLKERGEIDFKHLFDKYRSEGKMSLRRMQWETAGSGHAGMQMFLGQQNLDQSDKRKIDNTSSDGSMSPDNKLTDEELDRELERRGIRKTILEE